MNGPIQKKKKKEEDAWVVRRGFGSSCEWPETQEKIIRHASWPSWSTGGTAQDEGKSSDRHEEEEERDTGTTSYAGSLAPLWKAPYSAILSLAQDERHVTSTLLVILAAAETGSLGRVAPDFVSRALNHIGATSHPDDEIDGQDVRTRLRLLRGSLSASGGLGPLAVQQRLIWLKAKGLVEEEKTGSLALTNLGKQIVFQQSQKVDRTIPLKFSKPWKYDDDE